MERRRGRGLEGVGGGSRRWSAPAGAPLGATLVGLLLLGGITPLAGCKGSENYANKGRTAQAQVAAPAPTAAARQSARKSGRVLRSLVKEAARSEVDHHGLFLNLGTPDQHKYTLGGRTVTNWGDPNRDQQTTFLPLTHGASLRFHDWRGGKGQVVVKVRSSVPGAKMGLSLEKEELEPRPVPTSWGLMEFPLSAERKPGRKRMRLNLGNDDLPGGAVQVAWVWLTDGKGTHPPTRKVGVVGFGEPRRALLAPSPTTIAYYLEVPTAARLVFDTGADRATRFEVWASGDGTPRKRLFSRTAEGSVWREGVVDLRPYAGKVVRLELVTAGSRGAKAAWAEPDLMVPGKAPRAPEVKPQQQAKHLIHLLVDTARRDHYAPFNPQSEVKTPGARWLAQHGTTFTRAYSQANKTFPSVSTMLSCRRFDALIGDSERGRIPAEVTLLAEHLKKHGFTTVAFSANPFVSEAFGLHQGFDYLRNYSVLGQPSIAEELYRHALEWLEQHKGEGKRFYLLLHTMEPHHPYNHRQEFSTPYLDKGYRGKLGHQFHDDFSKIQDARRHPYSPADVAWIKGLYKGEVAYNDHFTLDFLNELSLSGMLDDSLVVFSNDHGEELFERGMIGHGHTLYNELIAAPLILYRPGLFPAGKRVDTLVSLMDLAPTLLEAAGVPPMSGCHSDSLLKTMAGTRAPAMDYVGAMGEEQAVVMGRYKLYRRASATKLFDLEQDPGETRSIAREHPITRRALEILLGETASVPDRHRRLTGVSGRYTPSRGVEAKLDPETEKILKSLGYVN